MGVAGLLARKIQDPGCSIPREGGGGGVPWDGEPVSGPGTHSPHCPVSTSTPTPHQEHLSRSLAALRSNQIITLKVCRFWKVSRPLCLEAP